MERTIGRLPRLNPHELTNCLNRSTLGLDAYPRAAESCCLVAGHARPADSAHAPPRAAARPGHRARHSGTFGARSLGRPRRFIPALQRLEAQGWISAKWGTSTNHTLRHTHGSHLLAAGVPLTDVSKRLGHVNPHVTATIYAHVLPGRDDLAAAAWEKFQKDAANGNRPAKPQKASKARAGR